MLKNDKKYEDIINLPHYVSRKHTRMSLEARSAQFAPFAALNGYDELIKETARETNQRIEITEEQKAMLNEKILLIKEKIHIKPKIAITYFVSDLKKDGGKYVKETGRIVKIERIVLENKNEIPILEIIEIIDVL